MKKVFTPLVLLLVLFSLSYCTKKDILPDSEAILGTWSVVDIRSNLPYDWNGDGYSETDIYDSYDYCERDIEMAFDPNGSGQSRQGCNAYWEAMYWQLGNNNRNLRIQLQGDDLDLSLIQFSSNIIVGEDHVYINGNSFIITYTLQRR